MIDCCLVVNVIGTELTLYRWTRLAALPWSGHEESNPMVVIPNGDEPAPDGAVRISEVRPVAGERFVYLIGSQYLTNLLGDKPMTVAQMRLAFRMYGWTELKYDDQGRFNLAKPPPGGPASVVPSVRGLLTTDEAREFLDRKDPPEPASVPG